MSFNTDLLNQTSALNFPYHIKYINGILLYIHVPISNKIK